MKVKNWLQVGAVLAVAAGAQAAHAHTLGSHAVGFSAGIAHPFTGLDHLLAMVAVGVWATQLGARALWRVPLAFLAMMAAGAGISLAGVTLPSAETGIAGSVLVLGLLIFFAARFPVGASMVLVGFFALFHGYAHGTALPHAASAVLYGFGFLLASAALHVTGAGLGLLLGRGLPSIWIKVTGAGIAVAGIALWG